MSAFAPSPPLPGLSELDCHCTFPLTSTAPTVQSTFICLTCSPQSEAPSAESLCLCQACADVCHEGHDVVFCGVAESYCDCRASPGSLCLVEGASKAEARRLAGSRRGCPPPSCRCTSDPALSSRLFSSSTVSPPLSSTPSLLRSCKLLPSLSKDTHWLPMSSCVDAAALAPLSAPEAFAASVFRQHLPAVLRALPPGAEPDPRHSGAEWWVQVKPIAAEASNAEAAVDLHYDKDEELSAAFLLGSFPDLSTVTYLTQHSTGKPTVIFDHCYTDSEERDIKKVRVSFPRRDKHVAFLGSLLHGAPRNAHLAEADACAPADTDDAEGLRVTLLVNVWVNNRPCGVEELSAGDREALRRGAGGGASYEGLSFGGRPVESVVWDGEEGEGEGEKITLHFVSQGSTWIEGGENGEEEEEEEGGEAEEFSGLVLQMPVLSNLQNDTTEIELLGASAAHLVNLDDDEEDYDEEEYNEEDYDAEAEGGDVEGVEEAFDAIEISTGQSV